MGKLFSTELALIESTCHWGLKRPIIDIVSVFQDISHLPLFTVGSGGSLTAAHFLALLHQKFTGNITRWHTPMELIFNHIPQNAGICLVSAGGSNPDIIQTFRFVIAQEPQSIVIFCATKDSPLARVARKYKYVRIVEYPYPSEKDGFLATNSLIAFCLLVTRGYLELYNGSTELKPDLITQKSFLDEFAIEVLKRNTISVLYSGWAQPAALDLESKFTEAALGNVQIADYRNFAHGRHYWLIKRALETGLISLITPDFQGTAGKVLDNIPGEIPLLKIKTDLPGPVGAINLLVNIFHLVQLAGKQSGIDPGCPRVPSFGRKIYHSGFKDLKFKRRNRDVWINRKLPEDSQKHLDEEKMKKWKKGLEGYQRRLEEANFSSLVLDYDGTLCDSAERFGKPPEEVISECIRLIDSGFALGIATGRGRSVRIALRELIPEKKWPKVIIGYYNGAEIGHLGEELPGLDGLLDPAIEKISTLLNFSPIRSLINQIDVRPRQISCQLFLSGEQDFVYNMFMEILYKSGLLQVKVVKSTHSIDILAPGVSKLNVVSYLLERLKLPGHPGSVLCIGDKGQWQGNDFELLSESYSLSVDGCSADPAKCWNLAPPGYKGTQATLYYLKAIEVKGGFMKLNLKNARG